MIYIILVSKRFKLFLITIFCVQRASLRIRKFAQYITILDNIISLILHFRNKGMLFDINMYEIL